MARIPELAAVEERSYWQATMPAIPDCRGADLPDTADVVVIGGGLTGLSAARRSAELGASTVLLEAERIGWGASTRNGGMCHPGFKHSLAELCAEHGTERGTALYRESIDAYEHVRELCSTRGRRRSCSAPWSRSTRSCAASRSRTPGAATSRSRSTGWSTLAAPTV